MTAASSLMSISTLSTQSLLLISFFTMSVLIIGQQIYRYIYNLYLHPLAEFPGPPLWAVSRIPHELGLARGRIIKDLATLHDKYGDVVRVSPNALSFIHPNAWQDIYARKPGLEPFPKDMRRYTEFLNINGAKGVLTADDADHVRLRRGLSPAFSDKGIRDQEPMLQTHAALLVQRLRDTIHDRAIAGKVDISCWLNWVTFDIMGDLAFGEPFGCLQRCEYNPWVASVYEFIRDGTYLGIIKQFPWLDFVFQRALPASLLQKLYDHQKLAIEKVNCRIQLGSDRDDMLNIILKHNGTEKEMSRDEMYSNANLLILAGSETSATAMAGCIYFLAQNRQVLHNLNNEIRSRFAREEEITFQALSNLTYLTAVLDETMRLYPPQPVFTPRLSPSGGAVVAGHFVPENTTVGIYNWTVNHSERNFRNPDCFDPSRWLNNPRYVNDRKQACNPFIVGYRNCIAKQFAYSEMRLIIALLIYNFDFELCAESQNWIDQKAYFAWLKGALMVQLSERNV